MGPRHVSARFIRSGKSVALVEHWFSCDSGRCFGVHVVCLHRRPPLAVVNVGNSPNINADRRGQWAVVEAFRRGSCFSRSCLRSLGIGVEHLGYVARCREVSFGDREISHDRSSSSRISITPLRCVQRDFAVGIDWVAVWISSSIVARSYFESATDAWSSSIAVCFGLADDALTSTDTVDRFGFWPKHFGNSCGVCFGDIFPVICDDFTSAGDNLSRCHRCCTRQRWWTLEDSAICRFTWCGSGNGDSGPIGRAARPAWCDDC